MLIETKNIIGIGTGRIVVDNYDGTVTKIPYGKLGLRQNKLEFELSQNKYYIASTILKGDLIIQEKLTDLIIVPSSCKSMKKIIKYLKLYDQNYDFTELLKHRLRNRIQIGKDKSGVYKYFDYEDVKYYENNNHFTFRNKHT